MEDKSAIIARVQKLLEVTEEAGATPEEAATAAAMAAKIMQKYQVSVSHKTFIQASQIVSQDFTINVRNTWKALDEYQVTSVLSGAGLERLAGVTFLTYKGSGHKRGVVYGLQEDIEFYFELLERIGLHLVTSMANDCRGDKSMEPRKLRRSYVIGYGQGFKRRVDEILAEETQKFEEARFSDGTALVVVKQDLIKEYFEETKIKVGKGASRQYNLDAASKGRAAAATAPINRSIKG